jgi:hypothetical protein
MLASVAAAALLLFHGQVLAQALDRIVVTTAPPLDSQRLADALRVYLGEFGISVEVAPADQTDDLRQRIADARQLGESVRAVAVIRAEPGTPNEVGIELTDLATDKTLIATMPKAARDEDLYRTLALKIQAILRATLSEARATLDPHSAVGRLVSESPPTIAEPVAAPSPPSPPPGPLALQAGYEALSLSAAGVVLQGAALTATYSLPHRFDFSLGAAFLASTHLSSGGVDAFDAVASVLPVSLGVHARWTKQRVELAVGPVAEIGVTSVTSISSAVPVRSGTTHDILLALGGEAELRLRITGPAWGYLRAGALGVLDGPRYDVEGVPVLDTSGLQLSIGAGVGLRFP